LSKNLRARKKGRTARWTVVISLWTFFLAAVFALVTRSLIISIGSIFLSFVILLFIIMIGIVFDIIGTAVTAAEEKPFHAKASKKIYGAKKGIYLVRRAGQVASFCNDVIGDISGVVSGVIAAVIIVNLTSGNPGADEVLFSILLTGLVSALTVGGKALGKSLAINSPTEVIMAISRLLTTLERVYFWRKKR
jgi:CBS domain containing-hemolysin-like protein